MPRKLSVSVAKPRNASIQDVPTPSVGKKWESRSGKKKPYTSPVLIEYGNAKKLRAMLDIPATKQN